MIALNCRWSRFWWYWRLSH